MASCLCGLSGTSCSRLEFLSGHTGEKWELSLPYRRVAVGVLKKKRQRNT